MNKPHRILLKLSGEYLGGQAGQGYDAEVVASLTSQVGALSKKGFEVGIVLGGGNFFRGAQGASFPMNRVAGDHIGMMATLMNALYLKESLISQGFAAEVMTGLQAPQAAEAFSKTKAVALLQAGTIMIFGGGTGNPYFSTDTAAVLRALEIEADVVIKGTKVDGVYDSDPMKNKDAKKYETLTYTQVLEQDLKVMDGAAIALCRENSLPLAVLDIASPTDLTDFLAGKTVGTTVTA